MNETAPLVNETAPLVSVLLASRNGERFLPEALASIASQTYPHLEAILVDDGSTDGTGALLEAFAASHPSARVLHTPGVGLASALALAAREARGDYLARHDDDDRSHPDRIARQMAHLAAHPGVLVLGTAARTIDAEGRAIGSHAVPLDPGEIRRTLRRAPPFVHGSVVMRRAAYEAAGGYRPAFRASQDYDLWLRLPEGAGLSNLPDALYEWRLHPAGVFSRARSDQLFYAAVARAVADERRASRTDSVSLLEACADPDGFLRRYPRAGRLALYLGEGHVREGLAREGRRYLKRALADPDSRNAALPWWILAWAVPWTARGRRAATRAERA